MKKLALIGNPNSGKTSLFNALTGLNQKVGNYPGVTVDKRSGRFSFEDVQYEVVDLPGVYGISALSEDEKVVSGFISTESDSVDVYVVTADATNLERSLVLFSQLYDLRLPVLLAINMVDITTKKGHLINGQKLSELLGNVPVVELNTRDKGNIKRLKEVIASYVRPDKWQPFISDYSGNKSTENLEERNKQIKSLVSFMRKSNGELPSKTTSIDRILIHPVWGYVVFGIILFVLFQLIFEFANWPMDLIDGAFAKTSAFLSRNLPAGLFTDLIVEGVVPGLGGVIIFVPQIVFLFLFLSLLEESGYMTRVVFLMDRLMRPFGLHGKSVVPMISGMACAIPAVMSARTIDQPKDRLITILVTPLMSCSARLPVYALMIALVIPDRTVFGVFGLQGLVLMGMYFLGLIMALIAALVFKMILEPGKKSYLMMEMPSYKLPSVRNVAHSLFEKVTVFVWGAGKIILAISIILWVLGSYGPGSFGPDNDEELVSKVELNESFIGLAGQQLEPVIEPLGYNWKIGIALITSFAAREVFVGTMATIYKVGDADETSDRLLMTMRTERKANGDPVFNLPTGLSLMVFYAFAMQCMSTVAIVKRETKGWKWPLVQVGYMTMLAYVGALITYYLAS